MPADHGQVIHINRISAGPGLPSGFPFSLAADASGICFISGMPAIDTAGRFVPGSFSQEADIAWRNVVAIAEASGCAPDQIAYVQCALGDMGDYGALNDWWRRQFPEPSAAPARFTFQAGALPFGAKIEFQAVAVSGG